MLVQFSVSNFRSIEEEVVFKMISDSVREHTSHQISTNFRTPEKLLRFGAIYGANASGKTNLIEAVRFARDLICSGREPDEPLNPPYFRFSGSRSAEPTCIEFILWIDNELYTYGFAVSARRIEEEWLYAQRPGAAERKLFERKSDEDGAIVDHGKSLESPGFSGKVITLVETTTRNNQLFLYSLADNNHKGVLPVVDWFRKTLTVVSAVAQQRQLLLKARDDRRFSDFLSTLLKRVGTGIERVELEGRKIDIKRDLSFFPPNIKKDVQLSLSKLKDGQGIILSMEQMQRIYEKKDGAILEYHLQAIHKDRDGNEVSLPIEEESDGTQRLVHLSPLFADAIDQDKVVFIDELDRRLHPMLSRALVELFNETGSTNSNTQLIFTTHDTHLFDQDLLRRDELWLMEKNKWGASQLVSLLDFDIRNDVKLSRNYLQGRFGGIPKIKYDLTNGSDRYVEV
ncbi:hypothetical protein CYPRO_3069 [Cyclonatronum proteinivorum]|uniref:ATPase AAA-type core domain-containing protein n=1 Tax=Cyclonatronum proteinivorum TaxID=1457365 RepID=A0A345UPA2_9BACT|nr:ATP-binding protein [Cyclonatronum proteinivorum]AXJ02304.1 hypothetical protein CYPRO_3069 [Cyclonatronum proteinivorum]